MNRLKPLRNSLNITQKELASFLGINQNTYSYWENGKVKIDSDSLSKLADYFDVSIDYLLGKSDLKKEDSDSTPDSSRTSATLNELMELCSSLSDEELNDVLNYVGYVRSKRKK